MSHQILIEEKIDTIIRDMPFSLKKEVLDYSEYLLKKYRKRKIQEQGFSFDWEGGLLELKDDLTSVQLQHKINEWR